MFVTQLCFPFCLTTAQENPPALFSFLFCHFHYAKVAFHVATGKHSFLSSGSTGYTIKLSSLEKLFIFPRSYMQDFININIHKAVHIFLYMYILCLFNKRGFVMI